MANIVERLTAFVQKVFKTSLEIFLEALKLSPNAQGYVLGSVTELLLKKKIEDEGYEVKRIREKWEGRKHPNHHGDFYFKAHDGKKWFVLESKGVKSNSEKWHKLFNYDRLRKFINNHAEKIAWINQHEETEPQIESWLEQNLPRFMDDYADNIYEYEEIQDFLNNPPKRITDKSKAIAKLRKLSRDEVGQLIEDRLAYVMSKVKVLETHFVSGTSEANERTQATPRKGEFNIVAIDIVLRYPEHKFLFANPKLLESSGGDPNHLQQDYIIGFVFFDENQKPLLSITDEWYEDFREVVNTVNLKDAVKESDMQIDSRNIITRNDD